MEEKLLTPNELWKGSEQLINNNNCNIVNYKLTDTHIIKELYVSSIGSGDNIVRTFIRIVMPKSIVKPSVLLYIPSPKSILSEKEMLELAESFAVVCYDYGGEYEGKDGFSTYQGTYSQYSFANSESNLAVATPSAMETPWYIWGLMLKSVIRIINNDSQLDGNNIVAAGDKHGSLLMWHALAFEESIRAGVSIIGYGFDPYKYLDCSPYGVKYEFTEDNLRWISALSAQAVARNVTKPILSLISTNNYYVSPNRLADLASSISLGSEFSLYIAPKLGCELDMISKKNFVTFIKNKLVGTKALPCTPYISVKQEDNKLNITIEPDGEPTQMKLVYSHGNSEFMYRNWMQKPIKQDEDGVYSTELDLKLYSDIVYYYITAEYEDSSVSTPLFDSLIEKQVYKEGTARIFYESRFGTDSFTVERLDKTFLDDDAMLKEGACGIKGLTTTRGKLVSYKMNDSRYAYPENFILQLDTYTDVEGEIVIKLLKKVNNELVWFCAKSEVKPSGKWEKQSFPTVEFKTDDFLVMKDWKDIYKMSIEGFDKANLLINNIIFI